MLTAAEIVKRIRDRVGSSWISPSSEGFLHGAEDAEVTGIVTTWTPTLEVLQHAVTLKHNMIISVEPPFWHEPGPVKTEVAYGSPPPDLLEKDPAYLAKKQFIDENKLVLWRFNENYKALPDDPRLNALADALHWKSYKQQAAAKRGVGVYSLPQTSLLTLAKEAASRVNAKTLRVVGDPSARLGRVVLMPGYITDAQIMAVTKDRNIDAVVCGEACQWEAFEYAEDWISQDWGKAFIMLGVTASEDPGGKAIAGWLKSFIAEVPSVGVAGGEPYNFVVLHEGKKASI